MTKKTRKKPYHMHKKLKMIILWIIAITVLLAVFTVLIAWVSRTPDSVTKDRQAFIELRDSTKKLHDDILRSLQGVQATSHGVDARCTLEVDRGFSFDPPVWMCLNGFSIQLATQVTRQGDTVQKIRDILYKKDTGMLSVMDVYNDVDLSRRQIYAATLKAAGEVDKYHTARCQFSVIKSDVVEGGEIVVGLDCYNKARDNWYDTPSQDKRYPRNQ